MRPRLATGASIAAGAAAALLLVRGHSDLPDAAATRLAPAPSSVASARAPEGRVEQDEDEALDFRPPTGAPAAMSCAGARRIVAEIRKVRLAYEPPSPSPEALASGTIDWLDPYGLWASAPNAPPGDAIEARGAELLRDLTAGSDSRPCEAATALGNALASYSQEIGDRLERARAVSAYSTSAPWAESWSDFATERASATDLASEVGARLGASERLLGEQARPYVDAAARRYAPASSARAWSEQVLAAAVRAWVPLVDPHGAWAPDGEESSVYDLDLEARPPPRAWTRASRTVLGLRIDDGAVAPLARGDVVLEVDGVTTGGLWPEAIDQLAIHAATSDVSVIRIAAGTTRIERVNVRPETGEATSKAESPAELEVARIAYGTTRDVAIVRIRDVPDDLGARFDRALEQARSAARPLAGVVIDLRGNGGGSTEGAIDLLATLLPGAPLFPMRRRDGTIETDRAPIGPPERRYGGPLATLVDAGTASAAEMIAGALGSYHRAAIVGSATWGKGCAQEYDEDPLHAGVLRLTTLLYALPDGSPVQRVGLTPWLKVPFVAAEVGALESESTLPHAPPSWRGPDVREPRLVRQSEIPWPEAEGGVGPCSDANVCDAIAALHTVAAPRVVARSASARGR